MFMNSMEVHAEKNFTCSSTCKNTFYFLRKNFQFLMYIFKTEFNIRKFGFMEVLENNV